MRNRSLIGRKLSNFEVKRLLGHGGMADVYYGWDEKLHRPVAIKVFETETRAKKAQVDRFIQEARMMAQWHHDNIVQIYSAGDETGLFYYVMEYIDGYDLASIMSVYADKDELMPIEDVLRVGESLANALDYAQAQGVIHRDVKPANVMIANEDGRVVLGDFGLALDLSNKSQGEVFGSPHYIAPEQARRSSDAVPQSDLYSLSVILYEMLTGATPFNDPSPASLALQHISEPPPLPRSINPALSESVEVVLLKALEKSPHDRYQSGREMLDALNHALSDEPVAISADASLPPIPVNAPTIQRSNISLSSFTKRRDVVAALEERSTTIRRGVDDEDLAPKRSSRKGFAWGALFMLLLLVLVWVFQPDLVTAILQRAASTTETLPTKTSLIPVLQLPITTSPSPLPTFTSTIFATLTPKITASPSPTATQVPTSTATSMPIQIPTLVIPVLDIPYPNGYLMTAHYDQYSFYLHNKGEASRSVSGFSFEQVNRDGTTANRFQGWEWQKYFDVIQPNRCVSLEVLGAKVPYLNPPECDKKMLSTLNLMENDTQIFWQSNAASQEFRVLWLGEEISRCDSKADTCDIYVP